MRQQENYNAVVIVGDQLFFFCCLKFSERSESADFLLLSELTKEFYTRVDQYCYRSVTLTRTAYSIVIFTFFLCISERYNKQDNFNCLNLIARRNNNNCYKIRREELQKIKTKLSERVLFNISVNTRSKLI